MTFRTAAARLCGPAVATGVAMVLIGAVSYVDYLVGPELNVVPLYFVPVAVAAWRGGVISAALIAAFSTTTWQIANKSAGLEYSHPNLWLANMGMQLLACCVVGVLIAYLRQRVESEEWSSRHDSLTGLPNGRAFYERAEQELARAKRYGEPLTAAYIDIDNFKAINDCHGHKAGDAALRTVARLLRLSVRASDVTARLGGDEFVVLMPETAADGARAVLERFRRELETALADRKVAASASIGAVSFDSAPDNVDELLSAADNCMYAVKRAGKNLVRVEVIAAPLCTAPH